MGTEVLCVENVAEMAPGAVMRPDGKYVCLPRIPRVPARDVADTHLDVCYVSINPRKASLREQMLDFLFEHYRSWTEVSGKPGVSDHPTRGTWRHPKGEKPVIEIWYEPMIDDLEYQYVTSVARWIALRIGSPVRTTVGKMSKQILKYCGDKYEKDVYRYEGLVAVYFNGHERWLVVLPPQWKNVRSPEMLGVGTMCDEHGFASQDRVRARQTIHLVQGLQGIVTRRLRESRDWDQVAEGLIQAELRRLSALW